MTKYLHTMIRVSSLEDSIAFFEVLGLHEIRRRPDEKGRYTNVFLAAPGDEAAAVELTYNWDPEPYTGGRNFGHLAYAVDNIYDTCNAFIAHGVTINRPPRDGRMAFIRTPDGISLELLQAAGRCRPPNPGPACPTPVPGRAKPPGAVIAWHGAGYCAWRPRVAGRGSPPVGRRPWAAPECTIRDHLNLGHRIERQIDAAGGTAAAPTPT